MDVVKEKLDPDKPRIMISTATTKDGSVMGQKDQIGKRIDFDNEYDKFMDDIGDESD